MIRTPEQIDTIITDDGISKEAIKILKNKGVKIVIA
jgi:DeoR/GlpR family transcriptional regulator of sugar metabolism